MAFVNLGNVESISSSIRRKRIMKTRRRGRITTMRTSSRRNMTEGTTGLKGEKGRR
jgi:hypothetical protein